MGVDAVINMDGVWRHCVPNAMLLFVHVTDACSKVCSFHCVWLCLAFLGRWTFYPSLNYSHSKLPCFQSQLCTMWGIQFIAVRFPISMMRLWTAMTKHSYRNHRASGPYRPRILFLICWEALFPPDPRITTGDRPWMMNFDGHLGQTRLGVMIMMCVSL